MTQPAQQFGRVMLFSLSLMRAMDGFFRELIVTVMSVRSTYCASQWFGGVQGKSPGLIDRGDPSLVAAPSSPLHIIVCYGCWIA